MSQQEAGPDGPVYSEWLGAIAPHQFQAALTRFDLGDLVAAAPVPHGLGGQNVFVSSAKGQYVLRGRPIYAYQFEKECFGAALLHERAHVPVAYPYLLDPSTDVFGWPYVLMPRLSGVAIDDSNLTAGEQVWVARAMGENLARVHEVTWPFAGKYDSASNTIQPFTAGHAQWFVDDTLRWVELAGAQGFLTADDRLWIEGLIAGAKTALAVGFQPCLVMGDYHPGNVLAACRDGEWRVSAMFDLVDYYFGDGEADLTRTTAAYLDQEKHQDTRLARAFGMAYLERRPARPGFAERYALAMVRDRLQVWEFCKRLGRDFLFPRGWSFRQYAERYVLSHRLFQDVVK